MGSYYRVRQKHIAKKTLTTMAVVTIKKDGLGKPIQARYHIVVSIRKLGPHIYTQNNNSLLQRLLLSLAIKNNYIPKSGNVSQVINQYNQMMKYIGTLSHSCPISTLNTH